MSHAISWAAGVYVVAGLILVIAALGVKPLLPTAPS
jgi:hypothetical protein